jgi:hypothetical protein
VLPWLLLRRAAAAALPGHEALKGFIVEYKRQRERNMA